MKRYAFTGPSHITYEQMEYVDGVVRRLSPPPSELTTGAASGVDSLCYTAGLHAWPTAYHRVVIPAAPWNEELQELFELTGNLSIEVIRMPPVQAFTDESQRRRRAYRARNERMLDHADELVAFVKGTGSFYRSGEWMTIRIAERRGIPVIKHLL